MPIQDASKPAGSPALTVLAFVALLAVPCSCWIIPWRLANSEFSSRYTFGYIGDEYYYAQRLQPLVPGTTATNSINGVCDPQIISPLFLEDACRAFITATGIDVPAFFWAWRVLFPLVLGASFFALAKVCLGGRRRSLALIVASAGAAMGLVLILYDVFQRYPPMQGWIHRIPTNCEYALSVLFAAVFVGFVRRPRTKWAVLLGLSGALLIYLRIYTAIPWAIASVFAVWMMLIQRRLSLRTLAIAAATLLLCLVPWLMVQVHNASVPAYQEAYARFFGLPAAGGRRPYEVAPYWKMMLGIAAALGLLAIPLRRRTFALSCAATVWILPFVAGLPSFSIELIQYERFGVFYLVAIAAVLLQLIGQLAIGWARRGQQMMITRGALAAVGVAIVATAVLATQYVRADFLRYDGGNGVSIRADHDYLPAYRWIQEHTAPNALFLVDDGADWSKVPLDTAGWTAVMNTLAGQEDLFCLATRRRRVFTMRMHNHFMSDADIESLGDLHRGTFGFNVSSASYSAAVKKFQPSHILWRKTAAVPAFSDPAPYPRGMGVRWKGLSKTVYEDDVCEIWQLEYGQKQ